MRIDAICQKDRVRVGLGIMAEYITLLGAEDVQRAGNTIRAAAETMAQAAASIDHSNEMFLRRYEELVSRMEQAAEKIHEKDKRSVFEQVFGKR